MNIKELVNLVLKNKVRKVGIKKLGTDISKYKYTFINNGNSFSMVFAVFGVVFIMWGSLRKRSKLVRRVQNASCYNNFEVSILDNFVVGFDWYDYRKWFSFEFLNFEYSKAVHFDIGKLTVSFQDYDKWYMSQLEIANDW